MTNRKLKSLAASCAVLLVAVLVGGAGFFGDWPQILPPLWNGTTFVLPDGAYTQLQPGQNMTPASAPVNCCGPFLAADTHLSGGAAPQTVKVTPFQVASTLLDGLLNTQTSTVHAATSNTLGGVVVTESLSTAVGSSYTFTLTNSLITAAYAASGQVPTVEIYSGTNTGGRCYLQSGTPGNGGTQYTANTACGLQLVSVTPAVGSVVWVWTNNGTAALNGTMYISWHL